MKGMSWLVCIVGVSLTATACNGARDDDAVDVTGTSGVATDIGTVRVADIVGNPTSYFGKTVTVEADLEEVFGPRAFALDEDAPFAGGIDRDLLVLGKRAEDLSDIDDQWLHNKVRVTGTVGRMSVVDIEREVGWDLDPQLEIELEGAGAVLIASSVDRVQPDAGLGSARPSTDEQARATLPGTASPLPLAGLLGLLALGAAIGLRPLHRG